MVNAFVTQFILIRNYIEHKKEEEEEGDGESKKHTHTHTEFGSYEYGATNPKWNYLSREPISDLD